VALAQACTRTFKVTMTPDEVYPGVKKAYAPQVITHAPMLPIPSLVYLSTPFAVNAPVHPRPPHVLGTDIRGALSPHTLGQHGQEFPGLRDKLLGLRESQNYEDLMLGNEAMSGSENLYGHDFLHNLIGEDNELDGGSDDWLQFGNDDMYADEEPSGDFGLAAGAFEYASFRNNFSVETQELLFKPLMEVVAAVKDHVEEKILNKRKLKTDEWLSFWTSIHQRETERTMKCIGRLYTAAAIGDFPRAEQYILELFKDGFISGASTFHAIPVAIGQMNWEFLTALMCCRTLQLVTTPSAKAGNAQLEHADVDPHSPAAQLASRLSK